jgi:plastocyanin
VVRAAALGVLGALALSAAFSPGHLADGSRSLAEPFGPSLAIDSQPAIHVRIYEYGFEPSRLPIIAGQLVVWRNVGEELHIVSPSTQDGVPVFRRAERLGAAQHRFTEPGRYPYHCSIHPQMRGTIVVRAS